MSVRFVVMALLVWCSSPVSIPADDSDPPASRWGITTKKILPSNQPTTGDEVNPAPKAETQAKDSQLIIDQSARSPVDNAKQQTAPADNAPADAGQAMQSKPKPAPTQKQSPVKSPTASPKKSAATVKKPTPPHAINWANEGQKKRCNGYLNELRSLFLKTRHYSIQGASCDTAESAAAFLASMETCKNQCPEGLLEHSGYTGRIIRNIRYLEKLGNDRCSGSLTPAPPLTTSP